MNATFTLIELKRIARDRTGLFFTAVLPAFFFIIFGTTVESKDTAIGSGNVATYVMISMAAYGAVTATTSTGGQAAMERMQGWGRQLGLTPLKDAHYVGMKAVIAMVVAGIPVLLIYALGAWAGARGSMGAWLGSGLIVLAGSAIFALYGVLIGTAFRSESAVGVASGSVVIFAFLGNIFITLSGPMLAVAKFTPLYGYVSLARYPLTQGYLPDGSWEPLWVPLAGVIGWGLVFGMLATWFVKRGRDRQ
ncbi:ABC transporter [Intrasporangium chromatireducens Q5-1]|uniref:ABC transporter n=1 Tax=Intrasporangium chromatireducens Q5-1 TaxID=584657 RepID=W9GPL8_9MICO|nr:ABC transporter permease [Intrasporangium chromatireducens]EWT06778.1 ABC transporter [Intrasporangium chromatireducens Q5-1]